MKKNKQLSQEDVINSLDTSVKVSPYYYRVSLRSSGYEITTALADIVDNSLEKYVNTKHLHICVESDNRGYVKRIDIVDDGIGMNYDTMSDAFTIGSCSVKGFGTETMGCYGIGLKGAVLSFAQKFTVVSKMGDGKIVSGLFDIRYEKDIKNEPVKIEIVETREHKIKDESYAETLFNCFEHGTIVSCTHIDRCSINNAHALVNAIVSHIGLTHGRFIENSDTCITVSEVLYTGKSCRDIVVRAADVLGKCVNASELIDSGSINGTDIKYSIYYVKDDIYLNELRAKRTNYIGRNYNTRGMFIYRNDRLVGSGIDFKFKSSDDSKTPMSTANPKYDCIRVIVDASGSDDEFFNMSYRKTITLFKDFPIETQDKFINALSSGVNAARIKEEQKKAEFCTTPEGSAMINKIVNSINAMRDFHSSIRHFLSNIRNEQLKTIISSDGEEPGYFEYIRRIINRTDNDGNDKSRNDIAINETYHPDEPVPGPFNGGGNGDKNRKKKDYKVPDIIREVREANRGKDAPYYTFPEERVIELNRDSKLYTDIWSMIDKSGKTLELERMVADMYTRDVMREKNIDGSVDDILEIYNTEHSRVTTCLLNGYSPLK